MSSYLEAITAMGNGSLHPGGFSHTLEVLRRINISKEDVVLEIGCGTGRTACYLAKTYGAHVFALDNSEKMLAKAKLRAQREGLDVHFLLGDALNMPFRNEVANIIFIESVMIFLPVRAALKECFRVLKRKGILVDIEMLANESLPEKAGEEIKAICGLPQIPTLKGWIEYLEHAGFNQEVVKQSKFPGILDKLKELLYVDPYAVVSQELVTDRELHKVIHQYRGLTLRNRRHLGFGTFIVRKD